MGRPTSMPAQLAPKQAPPDRTQPSLGPRPGSLVIVGSGIKAIGQITLEAQSHIRWADIVYYAVADPASAIWIREQNPHSTDLYNLYDNGKPRVDTYVQMAERLLQSVRRGLNVVAVFY